MRYVHDYLEVRRCVFDDHTRVALVQLVDSQHVVHVAVADVFYDDVVWTVADKLPP